MDSVACDAMIMNLILHINVQDYDAIFFLEHSPPPPPPTQAFAHALPIPGAFEVFTCVWGPGICLLILDAATIQEH